MTKQTQVNKAQKVVNRENDVSLKELFERVVALETKLDLISSANVISRHYFKWAVYLIVLVEAINFFLNVYLIKW